jgi:hypothetical protein
MRYTDEASFPVFWLPAGRVDTVVSQGELLQVCTWTVDISSLPTFRQNASMPQGTGFYTEFDLGLELDSAEVRGILLYEGVEWGRVVSVTPSSVSLSNRVVEGIRLSAIA